VFEHVLLVKVSRFVGNHKIMSSFVDLLVHSSNSIPSQFAYHMHCHKLIDLMRASDHKFLCRVQLIIRLQWNTDFVVFCAGMELGDGANFAI